MSERLASYSCSDNDVITIGKFLDKIAVQEVGTDLIRSSLDEIK